MSQTALTLFVLLALLIGQGDNIGFQKFNFNWAIDPIVSQIKQYTLDHGIREVQLPNGRLKYSGRLFHMLPFKTSMNYTGGTLSNVQTLVFKSLNTVYQNNGERTITIDVLLSLSEFKIRWDDFQINVTGLDYYKGPMELECGENEFRFCARFLNKVEDCQLDIDFTQTFLTKLRDCQVAPVQSPKDLSGVINWIRNRYYNFLLNYFLVQQENAFFSARLTLTNAINTALSKAENLCRFFEKKE